MEVPLNRVNLRTITSASALLVCAAGYSQIPDLLTAFDAGGRSLGLGSTLGASGSNTQSAITNPAGLGYSSQAQFNMTARNLTESETKISNSFVDPDYEVSGKSGKRTITHLGYIKPLGKNASLGLAYSVGGYIRDRKTGTNLTDGNLIYRNYNELLRAKTDLFAISYGKATGDFKQSFGAGLIMASHNTRNNQTYQLFNSNGTSDTGDDTQIPVTPLENSGTLFGLGAVVGLQFNPDANTSFGFSLRTPIELSGDAAVEDYYKRIPGKFSAGIARRMDSVRSEDDSLLIGAQMDYFFGGSSAGSIHRKNNQLALGVGAEYAFRYRGGTMPIRIGFRNVGKGGDGFSQSNAFTFGFGYAPDGSNYAIDLDFGSSDRGASDLSLSLTYRFK